MQIAFYKEHTILGLLSDFFTPQILQKLNKIVIKMKGFLILYGFKKYELFFFSLRYPKTIHRSIRLRKVYCVSSPINI